MKWYLKVLKNYAVFNGRARRKEYWMFILINTLLSYLLIFIDMSAQTVYLNTIYSLAVFVPYIAVTARRMHDVGKSGWFMLIPIYNFILAVTAGDEGDNEYGSDPKIDSE
tara:strand:- start:139 stop:468 length:330 start_codon:yes stop_codon:yes gene_type:complete